MITLASVIELFKADFLTKYQTQCRDNKVTALHAMRCCRTQMSPLMKLNCTGCEYYSFVPHSCGHRNCPHCQHFDKSAGKPICTASAARRGKVHGRTFMIVNNGLNAKRCLLITL